MKKNIQNIFAVLNGKEKKRFVKLVLMDVLASLLDIFFLALLLYLVHFYTVLQPASIQKSHLFTLMHKYPYAPIIIFLSLFSVKNVFGFIVFRSQFRFVYQVASRLSGNNMGQYLKEVLMIMCPLILRCMSAKSGSIRLNLVFTFSEAFNKSSVNQYWYL